MLPPRRFAAPSIGPFRYTPPMPRTALLLVNHEKPDAVAVTPEIRSLITRYGRLLDERPADMSAPPGDVSEADLIVVLGGDGTLLTQSRRFASTGIPLLGVNRGKLGFLAEFDLPTLHDQAAALFGDAPLRTRQIHMLRAEVYEAGGGGAPRFAGLALNECVVTAGPPYRMITLTLRINGEPGPTVSGDGLIVSTPTGSTAYNVSAGGPIVSPDTDAMVITPIAAHSLSFRPIVVGGGSRVEFRMDRVNETYGPGERRAGPGRGTTLVLDGQTTTPLAEGERVVVVRDGNPVTFVTNPKAGYWTRLVKKMHWAAGPNFREPDGV